MNSTGHGNFENGLEDKDLFDRDLLKKVDFSTTYATYSPKISPSSPGENLCLRPLQTGDYDRGFLTLLTHLTEVGEVTRECFLDRFYSMENCKNSYFIIVIHDLALDKIAGAATLTVENKFIHTCATRGRIEDVVVDPAYRGKQLGKLLVETLLKLSNVVGCYKTSLDCKTKLNKFYQQCGFDLDPGQNFLYKRFHD